MAEVIPTIIPQDYADLAEKVGKVKAHVSRIQIDVMDGVYAPTTSWPYNGTDQDAFTRLVSQEEGLPSWELLDFEIDMMVSTPEQKIDEWISAGVATLIVHVESTDALEQIFSRAKERGVAVALALKPSTANDVLEPWIDQIAFVQCMGSDNIGHHGVALDEAVLGKIKDIKKRWSDVTIGIDIGVSKETAPRIIEAGAMRLASGSAIFESADIPRAIAALQNA
jgi:ribulose-phosphate 3-epimerase